MKRAGTRVKHAAPARHRRRTATRRPEDPIDVTVILLEGGYASTAIGPVEVFHSAGLLWNWLLGEEPRPRFRVRTASPGGKTVRSICVSLKPDCAVEDIEHTDIVVISASNPELQERIARNTALLPWLRRMHERGAYVAAICSGAAYLAEAGLLDGREATTHWGVAPALQQRYPKVRWRPDHFVTEDTRVCCSGGVYASIDISLYLVEKFCGRELALQTARALLVNMPRSRQSGYSALPLSKPHDDERIHKAEEHLRARFRDEVPIQQLAALCTMSPRNFIRRFKAATGRLPGEYLQMMRVSAARDLLENDAVSVQEAGARVGYEDAGFFRDLFKRHTGMTPAEYRERFGAPRPAGEVLAGP